MAFSKSPSVDTYQTKEVKLIWALENRESGGTKDVLALNGFYDLLVDRTTQDREYQFVKRDGLSAYPADIPSTNIRGEYFWKDQNKLFVAYDDKIRVVTGDTGATLSTETPFTSTTGTVGFTEFYYDDGSTKIVAGDGEVLVTFDEANAMVTASDPDLPTPFKPTIVFLDGYLFIVKADTSDIYNSNLNDPTAWTSGDFLTAEMLPDTLIGISRLNNYLVAFGSGSIEYFFDAGNEAGSPLQRNDTPVKQVGYLGGYASYKNRIYFVGSSATASPEVFMLEDFKMEELGDANLRRQIRSSSTFSAAIVSYAGHDFYVLTHEGRTYQFDLDTKLWTELSFQDDASMGISVSAHLPISGKGYCSVVNVEGQTGLFYFDPTTAQDALVSFPVTLQTSNQQFNGFREKFMSRLQLIGDKTSAVISVSWTDDDYQTFNTPRTVSMNVRKPILNRLGRFLSRAFRFSYTGEHKWRLRGCEVDYNYGSK